MLLYMYTRAKTGQRFVVCKVSFYLPLSLSHYLSPSLSLSSFLYLSFYFPMFLSLFLSLSLSLFLSVSFCLSFSLSLSVSISLYLSLSPSFVLHAHTCTLLSFPHILTPRLSRSHSLSCFVLSVSVCLFFFAFMLF